MIANWSTDTYFFHSVDNKYAMVKKSLSHKQNGRDTMDSPWILGHFPGNIYDSSVKIMIGVDIYVGKSLLSSTGPARCSQTMHPKWIDQSCATLGGIKGAYNGIKVTQYKGAVLNRDSHYKDKTVSRQSYLYNGNLCIWKGSLYVEMGPWCWGIGPDCWNLAISLLGDSQGCQCFHRSGGHGDQRDLQNKDNLHMSGMAT